MDELFSIFEQSWSALNAKGNARAVYEKLEAHYNEPHRAYHNLDHIECCLNELNHVREEIQSIDELTMALFFHDIIYDTKAKYNEEQSALLADEILSEAGVSNDALQLIHSLIMATKHPAEPTTKDEAIIIDIDLAILGQERDLYDQYEANIRQEYSWVPEADFKTGREAVLKSFLNRDFIFELDYFSDKYEVSAQENLMRALYRL